MPILLVLAVRNSYYFRLGGKGRANCYYQPQRSWNLLMTLHVYAKFLRICEDPKCYVRLARIAEPRVTAADRHCRSRGHHRIVGGTVIIDPVSNSGNVGQAPSIRLITLVGPKLPTSVWISQST
jgi:hypothetical protein